MRADFGESMIFDYEGEPETGALIEVQISTNAVKRRIAKSDNGVIKIPHVRKRRAMM